jgi:dihydrofolate synthase/folylpolyglutamate synthase
LSSAEVFSWLSGFINLERGQTPKSFRLDRMEALAELAGHPERSAPSIHIAGSKGKGSVTGMIASVLEAGGLRAGRYMSPHVSDVRERLCLGSAFFDESIYCAAGDELREIAEIKVPRSGGSLFDPAFDDGEAPSYFELLTLYFFLCARLARCDAMVIETGMGGRLDCTNIVNPLISVITLIELEHTKFLGNTLAAVAGEKAGIIKARRPVVLAKQSGEALGVFQKQTEEKQSPLYYVPGIAKITGLTIRPGGTDFTLSLKNGGCYGKLFVPVPGAIQAENAAIALIALKSAFPQINEDSIRRGLERSRLPARFETLRENPPVIIDGAHTPESAALCAETFRSLYGEGGILLFGCAADKNPEAMAQVLLPHFSRIIITTPGTFKASDPEKVYQAFARAADAETSPGAGKTVCVNGTREAITRALSLGKEKNLPLLCTGSFYLASEIRAVLS